MQRTTDRIDSKPWSCPALEELPAPPAGREGWPWRTPAGALEARPASGAAKQGALEPRMPDGNAWPAISVVMPSLNQGQFIEQAIRSVLLQGYPDVELIVIDGGSTDATVDVLRRYDRWISHWVSRPDQGQSSALNVGFHQARGQLIGWQNSDDYYASGAFAAAARAASRYPEADVLYGACQKVDASSTVIGRCDTSAFDLQRMFPWAGMFNQSMFFRPHVFARGNWIKESQRHYMDHEFFWRLILGGHQFQFVPEIDAFFRIHAAAKGTTQFRIASRELFELYAMIALRPDLPPSVRRLAIRSMRDQCGHMFAQSQWDLFASFVRTLARVHGLSQVGGPLLLRYLLTYLGSRNVVRLRTVYHGVMR